MLYLMFALYALNGELNSYTIMANLGIVVLHFGASMYEILNDQNSGRRKLFELICMCICVVDILTIMCCGSAIQDLALGGKIQVARVLTILLSTVGTLRSGVNLVVDFAKAELGIAKK